MTARLSRHTILLLISNIGGAGLSFLLTVLIGRTLGESGLGVYGVVLAWVFPLSLVVEFGLASLATRDIAQDASIASLYLIRLVQARLLLGGLVALLLILLAPVLSGDPLVVRGLVVSAPLVVILPFYSAFTAVFKARGAMWPVPWLNLGMLLAQVVGTLLVFREGGGVLAALVVNVLTSLGQLVAAWLVYRWRFHVSAQPGRLTPLRDLLRRAWPFALAALFAALQTRVSLILLESLAGLDAVGHFVAAGRFLEAARLVPNAFFGALFPLLSGLAARPLALQQTFTRATLTLAVFGLLAAIAAFLLAPALMNLVFGPAFAPAVPVLPVLMLSLVFSLLRGARTLYWYALNRETFVNRVNAIVLATQLALSLWLIPVHGALGAAQALVIVEAVGFALLWHERRWRVAVR